MSNSATDRFNWIHEHYPVIQTAWPEMQLTCPKCQGDKLYFNVVKNIGICHRAGCKWFPNITALALELGISFYDNTASYHDVPTVWNTTATTNVFINPITLPQTHVSLVWRNDKNDCMTSCQEAVKYLLDRNVSVSLMEQFDIQCDPINHRVTIPIREDGQLLSYVSRLYKDKKGAMKYLYPRGGRHGETLLGWDEAKLWGHLTLVENSFVSLSLRYVASTSTTFGSNITDAQADKIAKTKIKSVGILWDEGADRSAQKAVRKLHERGVNAAFGQIEGQPDDYSFRELGSMINRIHRAAEIGEERVDFRGV